MKRVLFVDDERSVLSALERMLRPHRDRWNMTFVQSGAEALAHLEHGRVDVVVTDMRMPGMNGAELLHIVRERCPDTVRIVLSGEVDVGDESAQVWLYKPCDAGVIIGALDTADAAAGP